MGLAAPRAQILARSRHAAAPHPQDLGWEGLARRCPLDPSWLARPGRLHPLCPAAWVQVAAGQAGSAMAQRSLFLSNVFYC